MSKSVVILQHGSQTSVSAQTGSLQLGLAVVQLQGASSAGVSPLAAPDPPRVVKFGTRKGRKAVIGLSTRRLDL